MPPPALSLVILPLGRSRLEFDPVGGVDPRPPGPRILGRYGDRPEARPRWSCGMSESFASSEESCWRVELSVISAAGWSSPGGEGEDVDATLSVVCSSRRALILGGSRSSAPRLMLRWIANGKSPRSSSTGKFLCC